MKRTRRRKLYIPAICAVLMGLICFTIALSVNAADQPDQPLTVEQAAAANPDAFSVNDYGLTYGNGYDIARWGYDPDLILAQGIDGTIGYVYTKDMDGFHPSNPEEAVAYMHDYEQRRAAATNRGEQYERIIPLYDETGQIVIGEFGLSWAWPLEEIPD